MIGNDQSAKGMSQLDDTKLADFYNKYGIIKMNVNLPGLETFTKNYIQKVIGGINEDIENKVLGKFKFIPMISGILSTSGFILIEDKQILGRISGYDNIETFADVFEQSQPEMQELELVNEEQPLINLESIMKEKRDSEMQKQMELEMQNKMKMELEMQTQKQQMDLEMQNKMNMEMQQIKQKTEYENKQYSNKIGSNMITLIIPKILLTPDRTNFIDFVMKPMMFSPKQNDAIIIQGIVTKSLDSINSGTNAEIKVANLLGLLIRVSIALVVFTVSKEELRSKPGIELIVMTNIVQEFISEFPEDKCIFYNNKIDFVEFSPNLCSRPKTEEIKEEIKCPMCPETKCSDVKIPEIKCPDVNIPEIKCPDTKCPDVTVQETKCPDFNIPEIKCPSCPETKCADVNIPEIKCPACPACPACQEMKCPDLKCPEVKVERQALFNFNMPSTPVILAILGGILLIIYLFRNNDNKISLSNLAKL